MKKTYVFMLLAIITFSFLPYFSDYTTALGPTYIRGNITSDTIWNLSGSPYIVTDNVTVNTDINLTIEPGTVIKLNFFTRILIDGALIAEGSENNPILFTSNQSSPAPGDWGSIKFSDASNDTRSILKYTKIEYAIYGIWCDKSSPVIEHNSIDNTKEKGIYLQGSNANIVNNSFTNAGKWGIDIRQSNPTIINNTIINSFYYNIKLIQSSGNIKDNVIIGGINGIHTEESVLNISNNLISSTGKGISLENSPNTTTNHNHFIGNEYGLYIISSNFTYVNESIFEDNDYGIYCRYSCPSIFNSTFSISEMKDFFLTSKSYLIAINTSFDSSNILLTEESSLTVKNYLRVQVEDEDFVPMHNASVYVEDNNYMLCNIKTNNSGLTDWILVTDVIYYMAPLGLVNNITTINVTYENEFFLDNPREVDMNISHTEVFTATNLLPLLNITYPKNEERVNQTITIEGRSLDNDGFVQNIDIQIDEGPWLPGTNTGINMSTWSFEWNTSEFDDGYYIITAKATDNEGAVSTVTVDLIVDNLPNSQPSVNITSHQDGEEVNHTVIISGTASDPDGSIHAVEIQVDEGPWQNAVNSNSDWATWSFNWNSMLYVEGNHIIITRAIDDEGANSPQDSITLMVKNLENGLPRVDLVSYFGDEEVSGIVTVMGESSDEDGVVNIVEIQIDDGTWQPVVDTGIEYSSWDFKWDTTLYLNGEHIIRLRAIDDKLANSAIYSIALIVNNGGNMPPIVEISSHSDGEEITGLIILNGVSSDSDGIVDSVQIKVNDDPWKNATKVDEQWSLWNFNLDTTQYSNGEHIIFARSIDSSSTYSTIDSITIIIYNGGNMPPSVYITSHNEGEQIKETVILKGISVDRDGFISNVEIQIDDGPWQFATKIALDWSAWQFIWDTLLYTNGVHQVNARCSDNVSSYSTIHTIEVSVDNGGNLPPTIDITSHSSGEVASGTIVIKGIAIDPDGIVQNVMIQIENGSWQTVTKTMADWSKWSFNLDTKKYENGDYTFIVKVTDNQTAWAIDTIILHIENEETIEEPGIETDLSLWEIFIVIIIFFIIVIIILIISMRSYHKKLEKIKDEIKKGARKKRRKKRTKKVNHTPTKINPLTQKIDDTIEELEKFEEFIEDNP